MKTIISSVALAGLLLAFAAPASAAGDKEITITGEGKCAKCALHEADKCQTVIQTQEDGKTVTYYLAPNKASKDFHENVCQDTKKVTATGKVKEEHGKKVFTVSKIELAK